MKKGGLILWKAIAICEMSKTSWQPFERTFQRPKYSFWSNVEYHPTSPTDQARIHQFGKKVFRGIFLGFELMAGGIWNRDVLMVDLEDLEKSDA